MIDVKDLSYKYPNSKIPAIKGLNFSISRGEIFGFLGPSGSGKSTTQKILFKLLSGYTGTAYIDNKDLADWNKGLYERIGVGFELPNHYLKLTALENLHFFAAFYRQSLSPMKLLEMLGLEKDANKRVSDFSKGMKMRLNFVRALLHDPDILFLDEPTSGLDPVNSKMVKDLIFQEKAKGKTIFITTHQMHDADELCDRVAFIVDGKIKVMDKPANLKLLHSKQMVKLVLKDESSHIFEIDHLGMNEEFLSLIKNKAIKTIHSKEATLDEVFIKITGQYL